MFIKSNVLERALAQGDQLSKDECDRIEAQISSIGNILNSVEKRINEANPQFASDPGLWDNISDFSRSYSTNSSAGGAFVTHKDLIL